MTGFINKKIETIQTLGERLEKHRQDKGLSRDKAARAININVRYIKYLENNDYKQMPADVYALNIIRSYADLLNLNPSMVEDLYKNEKNLFFKTQRKNAPKKLNRTQKIINKLLNPHNIKYAIIVCLLSTVIIYLGFEVNKIISPPELLVFSPMDNLITSERIAKIEGQTEKEVQLKINNRPLLSDKQGLFKLDLDLQKGLNIIKISAQKKYSKEQIIYKKIIVTDESDTAINY